MSVVLVFVHGWSVTNLDTYGGLPLRLQAEGAQQGMSIEAREIFLGRYVSFHDEVRMPDVSRAFETAVRDQLGDVISESKRFVCITHSTGGPVARDWWNRFYKNSGRQCPMSHLIMLAPANFGSALARLGKQRVGRLKSWFSGTEPGQGILDWLELGSYESWELNRDWILNGENETGPQGVFPFVLTGQSIDRKFYDHLNSYTGEAGSDGVVRVAAANLESTYIRLTQSEDQGDLTMDVFKSSPPSALRLLPHKSHSGTEMGVMASVKRSPDDVSGTVTVDSILRCIGVQSPEDYQKICREFLNESRAVQELEKLEEEKGRFLKSRYFIHDRYSMIIFRVTDEQGYPVRDYDLVLTGGDLSDPDHLPEGFFSDRQQNSISKETITYFINYDIMIGTPEISDTHGNILRPAAEGITKLGLQVNPRPEAGFVRYRPCSIRASADLFQKAVRPNGTAMIDIRLRRIVDREVFRFEVQGTDELAFDFKRIQPGGSVV